MSDTLTGNDTLTLFDRVLRDFGDGDVAMLTFPNDAFASVTGKNGNSIYSQNFHSTIPLDSSSSSLSLPSSSSSSLLIAFSAISSNFLSCPAISSPFNHFQPQLLQTTTYRHIHTDIVMSTSVLGLSDRDGL